MKPIKETNFNEAIVDIQLLDNDSIVVVDSNTTIRFLDKENFELTNGFKANIKHLRYKTKVVEFSPDGDYFATLSSDCKESRLYNTKTKKQIARMNRHQGEASCVGMDPTGRYMFSCGDDGKTFALDVKSGKLAFTLPVHVDTINDIVFTPNGQWVATASYDKKVSIFNIAMMTPKHKLKLHSSPIFKLQFLTKHRLFSVDKKSSGIIFDIYSGKIIKRLNGIHDDVTQVTTSMDGKFLFLGTNLGYILIYELEEYELLSRSYLKMNSTVTALVYDDDKDHLLIGTDKGSFLVYDIYSGVDDIKDLLQAKDYLGVEKKVEENPVLAYTQVYDMLESIWEKTLEQAKKYLEHGKRESAIKIFMNFKNIPKKNAIMNKVLRDYDEFDKFVQHVKQGKLPLAYSMINTHPLYKETKLYQDMEAQWKKAFTLARKYTMDPRGAETAKEILKPYRGVSDKTSKIQELFTQGEFYKRFKSALSKKDFKVVFDLIKQHPFLKEFPEYETLMNYADTIYIKAKKYIDEGETVPAVKILRVLIDFEGFEEEVSALVREIEQRQKFFNAVEEGDTVTAYNILDNAEELQYTDAGYKLYREWNDALTKANAEAVNGNVASIKEILAPYINISSKYMAIGTVFGWCYMMQLENAVRQKRTRSEIETGIKNYILSFGLQDQILSFFNIFKKYYPDSKINLELQSQGSLKMWRPSMIVNSILD